MMNDVNTAEAVAGTSDKNKIVAAVLAFLFGCFGIHRFYVGRWLTGILQILTLGGLGIWALIDFILILFNEFKDADGNRLVSQ